VEVVKELTDDILSLFPNIVRIMERNFEQVEPALKITAGYILVGKECFLQRYIKEVVALITAPLGNVRDEGEIHILRVMEILLILFPSQTAPLLENALQRILSLILGDKVGQEKQYSSSFILIYF